MPTVDLIFEEPEGQLPIPHAWIAATSEKANKQGKILLTPSCTSYEEIERHVRILQMELDRALEQAGRHFGSHRVKE